MVVIIANLFLAVAVGWALGAATGHSQKVGGFFGVLAAGSLAVSAVTIIFGDDGRMSSGRADLARAAWCATAAAAIAGDGGDGAEGQGRVQAMAARCYRETIPTELIPVFQK